MCRSTNRQVEPEVWFRIVHLAQEAHNDAPVVAYHEQTVEIALGPKGVFENGNISSLTRRVATNCVVSAVPHRRGKPKPPKEPKTPRVVEFLRKAIEWRRQLDSAEVKTQADIARREGITRARVTQIMRLLRLMPEVRERILSMSVAVKLQRITERKLRTSGTIVYQRVF